ncbi:MAG: DUF6709 family protein [Candidatus Limivicinus sp.]|jgi:hypothetical protein
MAERKFAGVNGAVSSPELSADYEAARIFDKIRVGELGLYFREGLKTRFVDYDFLDRVFIRVNEVNGRMCCCTASFAYYRIVMVHGGREYADVMSENEKAMDEALAYIHEKAPALAIGYVKDEESA